MTDKPDMRKARDLCIAIGTLLLLFVVAKPIGKAIQAGRAAGDAIQKMEAGNLREGIKALHQVMEVSTRETQKELPLKVGKAITLTGASYERNPAITKDPEGYGYQGRLIYRHELECGIRFWSRQQLRKESLNQYCSSGNASKDELPENLWPWMRGVATTYIYESCLQDEPIEVAFEPADCKGVVPQGTEKIPLDTLLKLQAAQERAEPQVNQITQGLRKPSS